MGGGTFRQLGPILLLACVLAFAGVARADECTRLLRVSEINELVARLGQAKSADQIATRRELRRSLLAAIDDFDRDIDALELQGLPTGEQLALLGKIEKIGVSGKMPAFGADELLFLRNNEGFRNLLAATLYARNTVYPVLELQRALGRFLALREHVVRAPGRQTRAKQFAAAAGNILFRAFNFLSPIELNPRLNPVADIFVAQMKGKALTEAQHKLLVQYDALAEYERRAILIEKYPRWHRFKRYNDLLRRRVKQVGFVLSAALAVEMAYGSPVLGLDEFLEDSEGLLERDEIQILNETAPFPHTAIRIGNQVYSYGFEVMAKSEITQYLTVERVQALFQDPKDAPTSSVGKYMAGSSRSIQVVTLKLGPGEMAKLERYLNEQTGKKYKNLTHVNDCASMVSRALREHTSVNIPAVVDPSPFWLETSLLAQKELDPGTVRKFQTVVPNPQSRSSKTHLVRNVFINYLEGRLYQAGFIMNMGRRGLMELRDKPGDIQYWDETSREVISDWEKKARSSVDDDVVLNQAREILAKAKTPAERDGVRDMVITELQQRVRKTKETLVSDHSADLKNLVEAKASLPSLRKQVEAYMKFDYLQSELAGLLTELDLAEKGLASPSR